MIGAKQGAAMIEYRIRIYGSDKRLHETRKIFAADDPTPKAEAQKFYDAEEAKRKAQSVPKIEEPRLGGFRLYRLIHDTVI
jgi:hypothetical protein